MKKIALIYNPKSDKTYALLQKTAAHLLRKQVEVAVHEGRPGLALDEIDGYDFSGCDAAISFGGDGTVLAAARAVAPLGLPLFGVNLGRLGFLSSAQPEDVLEAADRLLAGDYREKDCLMITCRLFRDGALIGEALAFNDFVVSSLAYTRAMKVALYLDGRQVHSYNADGLIVATPAGSTGYSLSAGGPILLDGQDLLLITPVCPHSFFNRPLVAGVDKTVELVCESAAGTAGLTADGQFRFSLQPGDRVAVSPAPFRARLVSFGEKDLIQHIKDKLFL